MALATVVLHLDRNRVQCIGRYISILADSGNWEVCIAVPVFYCPFSYFS
jgi:hypothetical protein